MKNKLLNFQAYQSEYGLKRNSLIPSEVIGLDLSVFGTERPIKEETFSDYDYLILWLKQAVERKASDLFISCGESPKLKILVNLRR